MGKIGNDLTNQNYRGVCVCVCVSVALFVERRHKVNVDNKACMQVGGGCCSLCRNFITPHDVRSCQGKCLATHLA